MCTIYKYPFKIVGEQELMLPKGATPLHIGLDPSGAPCLWAKLDTTETKPVKRRVYVVGTGMEITFSKQAKYFSSFVDGPYVWHVFMSD